MKASTKSTPNAASDPVWCERCRIRIAPYDARVTQRSKSFHQRCFVKNTVETKARKG